MEVPLGTGGGAHTGGRLATQHPCSPRHHLLPRLLVRRLPRRRPSCRALKPSHPTWLAFTPTNATPRLPPIPRPQSPAALSTPFLMRKPTPAGQWITRISGLQVRPFGPANAKIRGGGCVTDRPPRRNTLPRQQLRRNQRIPGSASRSPGLSRAARAGAFMPPNTLLAA